MAEDYIPGPDDEFNTYATEQFGPYAAAHAAELGISAALATKLSNAINAWGYSWTAYANANAAASAATADKNTKRAAVEEAMREVNAEVQTNKDVTPAQKEGLGVKVYKTSKTPAPVPATAPMLNKCDKSTRCILRLFYVDTNTPDTDKKPAGVKFCEVRAQIGGSAPTDPEEMDTISLESKAPYRFDFEAADVGKTVWIALRWINTNGKAGPWGGINTATVPG